MALIGRFGAIVRSPKARRRVLAMGDQAASGLPQIFLAILAARYFESVQLFASIGLALVAYQLVIGGVRSVTGESLLSLYSHEPPSVRRGLVGRLQGSTLFLGAVAGLVLGIISIFLGGSSGSALLVLGLFMPLLMAEDAWRYVFIVDRPGAALAIDMVWVIVSAVGLLLAPEGVGVGWFIGVWSLGGALGALLGTVLGWWGAGRLHPWRWLAEHRRACTLYFGEFLTARGIIPITQTLLAAIAGMAALGAVRAALVLCGPMFTLQGGMYLVAVPEGAKARNEPRRMQRMMMIVAAGSATIAACWTAVLILLPDGIGRSLFGPTWDDAEPLMLPMGLMLICATLFSGALLGLRALGDAKRSFRSRLKTAPCHVVLSLGGAALWGAEGFALGLALAEANAAVIWWHAFIKALREIERDMDSEDLPDGELDDLPLPALAAIAAESA
jgi:O-antigen/teichoic acid export membrane protein